MKNNKVTKARAVKIYAKGGSSYREIASKLGKSIATIAKWIQDDRKSKEHNRKSMVKDIRGSGSICIVSANETTVEQPCNKTNFIQSIKAELNVINKKKEILEETLKAWLA